MRPHRVTPALALATALATWHGCTRAQPASPVADAPSTLIRGASVLDGTGEPARAADVRIRGDRIADVGDLTPLAGERVADGAGLALAPGFIDTHSHHDRGLVGSMPDAPAAVSQGITTIVVGQDGGSPLPLAGFFSAVADAGVAVNVASYAGHGTLRRRVMGEGFRREATRAEVDSMRALLRGELEAGALGLSTGLEYDPGIYASTDEVVALAREAAAAGGRYITHMRSEDRALLDAVDEVIHIGREARIPVQIGHVKLAMRSLWGRADELLATLDRARASGVEVTADVYPYTYWQSTMTVLFPDRDFEDREAAAFALRELVAPEGMLLARFAAEPAYEGRTLAEVAHERGEDPVTTYLALIRMSLEQDAGESIIATSMDVRDVHDLLRWPHTNVSSDGALDGAHPRGFGAFTRVLGPAVRAGVLSLEGAVHKMTALSAEHVGIVDRGVIRPGAYADLVLFDPATVTDRATPEAPHAPSEGIVRVWVNGTPVYEAGRTTGARPGRVVRRAARAPLLDAGPGGGGATVDTASIDAVFAAYAGRTQPGCALGVVRDGRLGFARGYGMADLEHDVPISAGSVFRTGSVGKQFTAAAVVLAAQDGFLSLDDPVRAHLPELPDFGPGFTIRRLLHHTSGVRDYLTLMTLAGKRDADWYSDQDVLDMLARQTAPNFEPGSDYLYSNSGYFLLGRIILRATGSTLAEYAARRIFVPLGMRDTHFHDDPTRIVPNRAVGYAPARGGGYRISTTTLPMVGDGGVFTTVRDLEAWDRNLDGGATVGGAAFVAEMHRRGVLTSGDTIDYALGLSHGIHRGLRTVGHGGSFVGFRAATLRYPDPRVSVYTLCNRADADPSRLSQDVGAVLLGGLMDPEPSPSERTTSAEGPTEPLSLPGERMREYVGTYFAPELDHRYRITLEDGALRLTVGNGLDGPLLAAEEDVFRRGSRVLRFRRAGGAVTGFELDAGRVRGIAFRRE